MCGATGEQEQLQQEQMDAYKQAQDLTSKQYANQQAIFAPMASQFQSILSRGPNQEGFSADQEKDLNAQAVEGTAENFEHAQRAVNESMAARGGGDNPLPSGGEDQIREEIAASSAGEQSSEEQQIKQASYKAGADQWKAAAGGLEDIGTGENPLGFEGAATNSGSAAASTADDIAKESNSWINAAIGAAGSAAGGWATGGFKH